MQYPYVFWFSVGATVILLTIMILSAVSASELQKLSKVKPLDPEVKRAYGSAVWSAVLAGLGFLFMAFVMWVSYVGVEGAKKRWDIGLEGLSRRLRFSQPGESVSGREL